MEKLRVSDFHVTSMSRVNSSEPRDSTIQLLSLAYFISSSFRKYSAYSLLNVHNNGMLL